MSGKISHVINFERNIINYFQEDYEKVITNVFTEDLDQNHKKILLEIQEFAKQNADLNQLIVFLEARQEVARTLKNQSLLETIRELLEKYYFLVILNNEYLAYFKELTTKVFAEDAVATFDTIFMPFFRYQINVHSARYLQGFKMKYNKMNPQLDNIRQIFMNYLHQVMKEEKFCTKVKYSDNIVQKANMIEEEYKLIDRSKISHKEMDFMVENKRIKNTYEAIGILIKTTLFSLAKNNKGLN
ncbi:hypothetical protein [Williamsoniiplasma lucivorax]|uniref:Uncharacterized protein n=1 Tax=Williamsoniiplasma lucivorax TaxID=209274 RepID=A0A2S5RCW4_9MOLU|nr:hypothetical protein [Williamsoniiplasma lucivorax]PPE05163.1 hypothetical protein ELUCI_v1c06990 [Williamsoniiplasma lucivorax]